MPTEVQIYKDGTIVEADIANNAVTTGKINAGAVTDVKIAANAVTTEKINFQNALVPIGGIIMWSGSIGTIPTGWALCNGLNGTPNLQDKFIVGAGSGYAVAGAGGSATATLVSHSHTASTNTAGDHAHNVLVTQNASSNTNRIDNSDVGFTGEGGAKIYILKNNSGDTIPGQGQQMIESAGSHSHTVTVDSAGSSATNANLPPYYALAFIMRTS